MMLNVEHQLCYVYTHVVSYVVVYIIKLGQIMSGYMLILAPLDSGFTEYIMWKLHRLQPAL